MSKATFDSLFNSNRVTAINGDIKPEELKMCDGEIVKTVTENGVAKVLVISNGFANYVFVKQEGVVRELRDNKLVEVDTNYFSTVCNITASCMQFGGVNSDYYNKYDLLMGA